MDENKVTTQEVNEETPKTYTEDEVARMIQAEADKRVNQALQKQQKKFDEAQKLSQMNADEKRDYEYNQRLAELEKKEQALQKREMEAEISRLLAERNLPVAAGKFLVTLDAETAKANVDAFEKMFNQAVKDEIKMRVATGGPVQSTGNTGLTKEQFSKMTLTQQSELYRTNPDLYTQLTT